MVQGCGTGQVLTSLTGHSHCQDLTPVLVLTMAAPMGNLRALALCSVCDVIEQTDIVYNT